jgi:hypothetical protein
LNQNLTRNTPQDNTEGFFIDGILRL